MASIVQLLALSACTGRVEKAPADTALPGAYDGAGYLQDAASLGVPDPQAAGSALQGAIDATRTGTATPVVDGYQIAMESAEEGCPNLFESDDDEFWYGSCSTAEGGSFSGYGTLFRYEDVDVLGSGLPLTGALVYGEGRIVDGAGATFELGGSAGVYAGEDSSGTRTYISTMQGGFYWDAAGAADTWLATPLSPSLMVIATLQPDADLREIRVTGGISGFGATGEAATFDEVSLPDGGCPLEPGGTIAVRDVQGIWYDLSFDDTCDGCGEASVEGEDVGPVCADFSAWLSWEDAPW